MGHSACFGQSAANSARPSVLRRSLGWQRSLQAAAACHHRPDGQSRNERLMRRV